MSEGAKKKSNEGALAVLYFLKNDWTKTSE